MFGSRVMCSFWPPDCIGVVKVLRSSDVLRSPVFYSDRPWLTVPITALLCVVSYFILSVLFVFFTPSYWRFSGNLRKLRGAEVVPVLPVSPVNKAESVPCSFIRTVCCEHVPVRFRFSVPSPCSLHLKALQALRIVFCQNNGLVVYPRGSCDVQTYKTFPLPFLSVTAVSPTIVFAVKSQLLNNHRTLLERKIENTLILLMSNNKCSHYHPLLHVVTDLFSGTVCLPSLQMVVMDNMMKKNKAHTKNLGFYSMSSHILYFAQS